MCVRTHKRTHTHTHTHTHHGSGPDLLPPDTWSFSSLSDKMFRLYIWTDRQRHKCFLNPEGNAEATVVFCLLTNKTTTTTTCSLPLLCYSFTPCCCLVSVGCLPCAVVLCLLSCVCCLVSVVLCLLPVYPVLLSCVCCLVSVVLCL